MNVRRLAMLLSVALGQLACSGAEPPPGASARVDAPASDPTPGASDDTNDTTDASSSSTTEGGGGGAVDAGADSPAGPDAAPVDAFTGAPAYTNKLGPSTRKAAHPFPNDNPAGRACFGCHGNNATSFSFAGTVYANAAGTQPAAGVEVRLRDGSGKALSAWTNADGNFFFLLEPNGDLGVAHAGIRDADGTKLMKGMASSGDCNDCHKAGAAGRLVAP